MYEASSLDVCDLSWEAPDERERIRSKYAGEYVTHSAARAIFLAFPVGRAPFNDPRLRRAIAHATDREALPDVTEGRAYAALGGFVPPGIPGHLPDIGLSYDPECARQLLAEAGYPGGEGFPPVDWLVLYWAQALAENLQAQWRETLGLETSWRVMDWADLDELLEEETDIDDAGMEETIDRVILEDVPEAPVSKAPRHRHILALRKDFWITLALVCMLGTGFNLLLWRHNKGSLKVLEPQVLSFPVVDTAAVAGPLTFRDNPRALTLKGFLVPAPIERKDLTYITADVSIELTHVKAVSLIKAHAPFYRNIIYEVIKKILRSLDKSKISEISLKIEILKALNGSVPERSVRDVNVDTFVMF